MAARFEARSLDDTVISIPSLSTAASPQHDELRQEMMVHAESIRCLKSRWNTLATISRLPDELLAGVFVQLNLKYRNDQLEWRSIHRYQWIAVCQVCSHWRTVALNSPTLWSDVTITRSADWMKEVLQRSQRAPLRVQIAMTSMADGMGESAKIVLGELSRVEEVVVGVSTDAFAILETLDVPAPMLRRLTVEAIYHRMPRLPGTEREMPTLRVLTHPSIARLERLTLLHCPFPWHTPVSFTSLSHLKVVDSGAGRPSMIHVIATLAHLRDLESLDLEDTLPARPADATSLPASSAPIDMPRLKSLRLVGESVDCADLLNRICFPSSIHLAIECTSKRGVADLAACLRGRMPLVEHPHALAFDEDFSASSFRVRIAMDDGPGHLNIIHPLTITFKGNPGLAVSASPSSHGIAFCLKLALANVRTLHIAGIIPPNYDEDRTREWLQLFVGMNKVEVLRTSGLAAYRLADMLTARTWHGSNELCFRALRRVEVENVTFGVPETFMHRKPGAFTEQLVQSLLTRSREAPQLETLVVMQSKYVDLPDIRTLESVVGSVEWDGLVDADPEHDDFDLNYY